MQTFILHIQDTRYSVPTLHFLLCETEAEARLNALRYLGDSEHHISAEVFLGGEQVLTLTRADLNPAPGRESPRGTDPAAV